MVEAEGHLKLLPPSTLNIYKVFEHIDMLSIGIWYQPYTVIPTVLTFVRFWGSGLLVESKQCHYIMVEADSHLKFHPPSILETYKVFEHIDLLFKGIQY